jgi:protein phosphatase
MLRTEVERNAGLAGMATTLTLALVAWPHAWLVHAGDSRCYLVRGGSVTPLTRDQTIATELAAAGALSPDEAARSPMRSVLSSSVTSGSSDVTPETRRVELRAGDWLLLVTDGLYEAVPEKEMARIVGDSGRAAEAARELVGAARAASAGDDATVVAVRLDGTPA